LPLGGDTQAQLKRFASFMEPSWKCLRAIYAPPPPPPCPARPPASAAARPARPAAPPRRPPVMLAARLMPVRWRCAAPAALKYAIMFKYEKRPTAHVDSPPPDEDGERKRAAQEMNSARQRAHESARSAVRRGVRGARATGIAAARRPSSSAH